MGFCDRFKQLPIFDIPTSTLMCFQEEEMTLTTGDTKMKNEIEEE